MRVHRAALTIDEPYLEEEKNISNERDQEVP